MATLKIDVEKAPQASLVELIKNRVGELPANDRQFAYSLVGAALSPRGLTEKQAMWVRKMADRIVNPKKPTKPVEVGDVSGLVALFAKAKASGLQWPKLRAIMDNDTVLTLRLAGEKSSHTGQIMVTSGKQENRLFYGRVDLKGAFHASQQPNDEQLARCVPVLKAIATDPAAAGKAYGMRTGNCAFCSLPLEDGRSVEVGYGPVCAEKWGLPWGAKPKAKPRAKRKASA
jgi:hypothetical protein